MYDFDCNYNHRHNRHHHHWQKNEWLVGTRCALHCLCLEAQTLPTPSPFKEQDDDDDYGLIPFKELGPGDNHDELMIFRLRENEDQSIPS